MWLRRKFFINAPRPLHPGKNYAVFCFAGKKNYYYIFPLRCLLLRRKKKLLFYIYDVIVKQIFYKRSTSLTKSARHKDRSKFFAYLCNVASSCWWPICANELAKSIIFEQSRVELQFQGCPKCRFHTRLFEKDWFGKKASGIHVNQSCA